jgi:DNA-directed RNA polymerase subunit F
MGRIEIINEKPLTLAETKELIEKIEKRDKEISTRTQKTKEYVNKFAKLSIKEVNELKTKLLNLNLTRLKEKAIAKIIDIYPKDLDSLRTILTSENLTLKQEDLQKIIECLK